MMSADLHPAFDPAQWSLENAEDLLTAEQADAPPDGLDQVCALLFVIQAEQRRQADLLDRLIQIIGS